MWLLFQRDLIKFAPDWDLEYQIMLELESIWSWIILVEWLTCSGIILKKHSLWDLHTAAVCEIPTWAWSSFIEIKNSVITFLEEGLTGGADPLINPLIHPIRHTVTSLFFYNERPTFLPLFLILAQCGAAVFIILLSRWTTGCEGCGWRMWLSALLLCFHPVWPPPWLVSEQPASPVPAWWLCSWFWLLWGCRPKTSACWSLLIGCCKFKQDVRLLCLKFYSISASSVYLCNTLGAQGEVRSCWRVG